MKQKNFLKIAMLFVFAIISNFSYGQLVTTIDFETENSGYTLSDSEGSTFTDVFNRIDRTAAALGGNNSFLFAIEDTSIPGGSIQLSTIDVSGSSSFTFSIDMLAHHYQDWDASDELLITYSLDSGPDQNLMWVQAVNVDGSNAPAALDLAFDNDGDCGASTTLPALTTGTGDGCTVSSSDFATFVTGLIALSDNSTLDIKLQFNNLTSTDEGLYLDNIIITETVVSTDPSITFDTTTSAVNETDLDVVITNGVPVTLTNYAADVTITPTVNGSSTAESGDFTIDLSPITFTENGTLYIPLTIKDDADFDDETVIIDYTVTTGTADLETSQHTVTITDDELAPTIGFGTATSSETETDATFTSSNIPITVSSYSGIQIDINVNVTGGTAAAEDFIFTSPTALSFTADGSQNITFDIKDDADADSETVIFTITESSSVSGLVISQSTHTVTITDDEAPAVPTAGTVFITEVSNDKGGDYNSEFIELYNNSNETISLNTSKLIRVDGSPYVYDFGVDETSGVEADVTIPAYSFMIVTRGATRAEFDTDQGTTLNAAVKYNGGNTQLYFGSSSRRWRLMTGGTANTDDGTLIDDTGAETGVTRIYRNIFTSTNVDDNDENGTPGTLEYLVYSGGAWVNSVAMDGTTAAKDAYIYDDITISTNSEINNFGIVSGKTVGLNSSNSLNLAGNLTTNNGLTINSGGSLKVSGISTGNVTYQVLANDTNWHLLSSPIIGATYDGTWISNNEIDVTNGTGTNIAIGTYTNTVDADGDWTYATDAANSGAFTSGKGYSFKREGTTNSYISFTGTVKTDNLTSSITQDSNNWNLVGNPYSSYILVSDLISDNAANLTDTHEMVYVWNGTTYTALTGTDYIHPGQGFFVNADNSNADNFTIDASKLSNQTGVTLYKGSSIATITLLMNDGNSIKTTKVDYSEDRTTGLDPRFDVGTFTGEDTAFSVYTQLVSNNEGVDFMRQSLPNSNLESMIIPIGVNAVASKKITFSAEALNLPTEIRVFLEDRLSNTFTRLDETNSEYKITLTEALNGVGRFYLHTAQSVLSTDDVILNSISIFKTNSSTLKIAGLPQGKTSISLYNILGKEMMSTSFTSYGNKEISLSKLSSGIYLAKVKTEKGVLSKKIILE